MSRSIAEIQQTMLDAKASDSNLSGLTSNSQTSIWRLFIFIVAACINVFEQLIDIFKTEIETTVTNNYVGTAKWIRTKCLEFQYSSSVFQILEIDEETSKISYPVIDTTLRIVTRSSVSTDINKVVNIKVAKLEPPQQLTIPENAALTGYLAELMPAGVRWNLINAVSDKLYIEGNVYFDGQYAAVIQTNTEASINGYLSSIGFDGQIKIVDLETAIRATVGVSDIKLKNVWLRPDSTPLINAFKLVDTFTLKTISAVPYAGYAVQEDTINKTWADEISYITI